MAEIIVALDVDDVSAARSIVDNLGDAVDFYKVGMELAYSYDGFKFVSELKDAGLNVFLDLKLHDIGTTVERATKSLMRLSPDIMTVHAFPQTMAAAVQGRGDNATQIVGVTILTSYSQEDAFNAGYVGSITDLVLTGAARAISAGVDGIVCSANEAASVRSTWKTLKIVTPGIRMEDGVKDDQARATTPRMAVKAGANYLVVGRPITRAVNPQETALKFKESINV